MSDSKYKKYTDEWFLNLYFKYGSVEEALNSSEIYLPISAATFHRKLNKYNIVGSAGRHVSLPEALHFFRTKAMQKGTPIERLYKKMPHNFQTSLVTLHRIYHAIEKQIVRRHATVLLISHPDDKNEILIANENNSNSRYGKNIGDITVPTGFSKKDESDFDSVMRVLQQEFSTKLAINNNLINYFDLKNTKPFMFLDIIDVRVKIYHIVLSSELTDLKSCSSYKLNNFRFENINNINKSKYKNIRSGADEIISSYKKYLSGESLGVITSNINLVITDTESSLQLA